ncbi:alpha-L-fucosidase [Actinopolymorpha sp. NPDC004070]|uniref:alpha-L-fucosidase n=1 Tax=Actinopolymorpha sp. NPDC004070 TaxID=3154548 RepID=UPI0033B92EC7
MPAPQASVDKLRARRFGLFVHWGLYALPARHEWVKKREKLTDEQYQPYFDHFDPDLYDPRVWAKAAAEAGMKYTVLTTKHHEGFCLWDSGLTDYKATNTPAARDLVRPFVDAFRAEDLGVGFYHSLIDWHHPEYPVDTLHPRVDDADFRASQAGKRDIEKYRRYLHGQVEELLTRYGDIDVMWFDFSYPGMSAYDLPGKGRDDWDSEALVKLVRGLQPDILINNRLDYPGDFTTPEQFQPATPPTIDGREVPWEACQTLNGSWGYDRDNLDWKSPDLLVRMLVDSVSKDGNLLLNVGPTGRGEFDERALATLTEIGRWTRLHGRSIYGAGPSEFTPPQDGRYTQRGDRLYLHLFGWPFRHAHLPGLAGRIKYAQLLHDASEVKFREYAREDTDSNIGVKGVPDGTVTLELPVQRPDQLVPVVEIFLK